ncbi:MAG: redoxin domain-containing protein [Planctomycetes bacterium]|nr:redoxin domain-containing protein [Planctomycetota bacterium]MCH9725376.1 redoxin domain-containing protein [Planctomycetota bacterium]MCH9775234.1 redoxin domain-containing protein [Planctomycetota bacterium]
MNAPPMIDNPAPEFQVDVVRFGRPAAESRSLDSYAGNWLLLLFYPRDFSFVCPTELTAFSAQIHEFQTRNVELLAISIDTLKDHRRWLDTPLDQGGVGPLQFPLGSDPTGEVCRRYGAWTSDKNCPSRGLFLIDPEGILQYSVVHNTKVGRSVEETLRVVNACQSGGLCPASWARADGTIDVAGQLEVDRVLGHYRILEKLGSGAFGTVFAVHDLTLDRKVAVKIVHAELITAKDAVLAEARSAARLQHPNICSVYAVEIINGLPVIVMEYVEGQTLNEIEINSIDAAMLGHITRGIAAGLVVAHENDIVHGDLKPANIMVTKAGDTKLLDFGLAKTAGVMESDKKLVPSSSGVDNDDPDATFLFETIHMPNAPNGKITGTPAFMSPEQTQGAPVSAESDVFSFGLILCELLTGKPVLTERNIVRTIQSIASGAARDKALRTVPERFVKILDPMLAQAPQDRPSMSIVSEWLGNADFDGLLQATEPL